MQVRWCLLPIHGGLKNLRYISAEYCNFIGSLSCFTVSFLEHAVDLFNMITNMSYNHGKYIRANILESEFFMIFFG